MNARGCSWLVIISYLRVYSFDDRLLVQPGFFSRFFIRPFAQVLVINALAVD